MHSALRSTKNLSMNNVGADVLVEPSTMHQNHQFRKRDALTYYLQQAHKGHGFGTGKIHHHTHRLYRHGGRPKGVHDFQNLQFDPSIYRGRTFRDFREKNLPPFSSTVNFKKYCCQDCNKGKGVDVAVAKTKLTQVGLPRIKVGGILRPTVDDIIDEDTSGKSHHKQDDFMKEMAPFIIEQLFIPQYKEVGTQSNETKKAPSPTCRKVATGICVSTQDDICIIGSKEDPIKPIIATTGDKILEQSLLESIEEYELHQIRFEINMHIEKQRIRQREELKLVEKQLHDTDVTEQQKHVRANQFELEYQAELLVGARIFSLVFCNNLITQVFDKLRGHNYLDSGGEIVENHFYPWINQKLPTYVNVPRRLLNEIIRNVEIAKSSESKLLPLLNMRTISTGPPTTAGLSITPVLRPEDDDGDTTSGFEPPPNSASTVLSYSSAGEEEDYRDSFAE